MTRFSSKFGTRVRVLVILVLSFVIVACGSPGVSVADIQTDDVKPDITSRETAQIFEFTVTTDGGEVLGPFTLPDANEAYRFDVDVTASTLRFDVVNSNGGNTGLVEFAAYGTPLETLSTDAQDDATNSDEIDPDDDMN